MAAMPSAAELESVEAASCADMFTAGGMSAVEFSGLTLLSAPAIPNPDMNRVIGLGVNTPASEELLDQAIAHYPAGRPFFLQVIPDCQPPELHDWIAARGFTKKRRWVKVWRDGALDLPASPESDVRIDPAAPADRERFAKAVCTGFGLPAEAAAMITPLVGRPGWYSYLAFANDAVAGAAIMYLTEGAAHMVMGCTLPDFRRRGIQGKLLERRIADARASGARLMLSEAAEDIPEKPNPSLHNLLRLGFQPAYARENYQRD